MKDRRDKTAKLWNLSLTLDPELTIMVCMSGRGIQSHCLLVIGAQESYDFTGPPFRRAYVSTRKGLKGTVRHAA